MFGHMQQRHGWGSGSEGGEHRRGLARLLVLGLVAAVAMRAIAHRGAPSRTRGAWHA